ncbi:MAG TPA: tRNA (adenosine(37)-N6)-threonylcarbamoyltransferase complex dimerization subunit type 1 TsaB [Terrimicrobiaceae bacterium]
MILSLDTSTQRGSLALISGARILHERNIDTPRGRGGALFCALEELLGEAREIRRVVVGVGPGSYNGIRSAIAVAWGIATARKIPLVGISSLLGIAPGSYCAVGDARRGQYFFAHVSHGTFIVEPRLIPKDELRSVLPQTALLPVYASDEINFLPGMIVRTPHAALLGLLAAHRPANQPQPLYLKPAYITAPKSERVRP